MSSKYQPDTLNSMLLIIFILYPLMFSLFLILINNSSIASTYKNIDKAHPFFLPDLISI
jgi:hypothetical protein